MTMALGLPLSAIGLVALLAGCGGGGAPLPTPQTDPDAYFNQVIEPGYDADRLRLVGDGTTANPGLGNTAFTRMPTTGSATYTGYALLGVNLDGADATGPRLGLEGTASMTADFAQGAITGQATNFVGGNTGPFDSTTNKYPLAAPAQYYPGTIDITNGCIGKTTCANVTRPNQMAADFSGTLTGGGNTVTTSGVLQGDFKGNPIKGIAAQAISGTLAVNGTAVPGGFFVYVRP